MESQEVVPIEARAADRWSKTKATMRTMPVVVVKPGDELGMTLLRVWTRAGISPFPESGLDKTFGFSVGARSVRTGEVMAQAEFNDGSAESAGAIAVTVVGEQAADGNAQGGVISDRSVQKGDSGSSREVGQDLDEGNAGVVIDGDMNVLPTAMKLTPAASIGTNNHAREASQLLNIEVK